METIQNKRLSNLKIIKSSVDELDDDLKATPYPKKSFGMMMVGKAKQWEIIAINISFY